MIELIIPYINTRIETLNLFSRRIGLCDVIKKGEASFPAEYCEGEYKQVSDFDQETGTVYHRLTGDISSAELDEENTVSCTPFIDRTYPTRLVAVIKKSELNAYSDSQMAEFISNAIAFRNNKSLCISSGADTISVEVKSISTDREKIFSEEYKGVENKIPFEYSYIAIDYDIKISGSVSCFNLPCGEYNADYSNDYR